MAAEELPKVQTSKLLFKMPSPSGPASNCHVHCTTHGRASRNFPATALGIIPLIVTSIVSSAINHRLLQEKPAVGDTITGKWIAVGGWEDPDDKPPDVFWETLVGNLNSEGTDPAGKYAAETLASVDLKAAH
ncbi:uncharacterized protein MYCFIDRAFT_76392 [Pseudocercospora fijiensis CIRAD86]|uniref:Uncharacterized protein n=1 Tax=Pseudocercospora fijiensis (strain CIRAD86) TaxID=383855 RepID=N1QC79_PSEFD|nr:uncharacterized protein MYCFIDRAFT_76392 [Pseudocercospora fijiensis CIRAD86]EME89022.1 hypothetical protein MYCFIDRAFT_76392 [Pseudocercospora fijiensis CIRAD86]